MLKGLLLGPTGVGKTRLGQLVAAQLKLNFVDLDHYLAEALDTDELAKVLASQGAGEFYKCSLQALEALEKLSESWLVAVGAGTQWAAQGQTDWLKAYSICLMAEPAWLWQENVHYRRDPRTYQAFYEAEFGLLRQRLYAAADLQLDCTTQSDEQIVGQLVDWLAGQ